MPPPVGGSSGGCPAVWSTQGLLLLQVNGTTASPLWLELRGPAAWQAAPPWAVCRHACHQLLPWLRATFAMVTDAAWLCSNQQPPSTAPASGPVGLLVRPSASDPGGVGRGVLSLCCPQCMCVCGVLAHLASAHRCALCAVRVCCWWLCPYSSPPNFVFCFLALLCICFVLWCLLFFVQKWKRGRPHTAGTGMGNWCSGAMVLCPLVCVVGALVAAAPQECGSRVLTYTVTGQGGFG